ncbi:MAG: MYXO-CTERM sorting domain-containing protein [Planctomycetota bacterium]
MAMGASATVRTLVSVCYEDSGGAITVVPAPGAMALLGLAGVASRRRRR